MTNANSFLAAFVGGIVINAYSPRARHAFHRFGDLVAELFKLASVLVFGSLLATDVIGHGVPWQAYVFAGSAVLLVRPIALVLPLLGTHLTRREWVTVAWFGPKGFASLIFALLIITSGAPHSREMFHFIALTIGLSILLHSSTDVPIARMFRDPDDRPTRPTVGFRMAAHPRPGRPLSGAVAGVRIAWPRVTADKCGGTEGRTVQGQIVGDYALVGLLALVGTGLSLLLAAAYRPPVRVERVPAAWASYRFGFPVYALIFLSFDMEMIFMYPWAVVFADLGLEAFLDMLVFIAILSAGIAYAWKMGGLRWE